MSTVSRRTKWHPTPPPPPSPKILHLPRRRRTHRRKQTKPHNNPLLLMNQNYQLSHKPQENDELESSSSSFGRRERVEDEEPGLSEEKWRFQAEMLRAECNLLRMERELALNKLEKNRVKMETTLRSAVQTLQSGRKKIEEGNNSNAVLEEEIVDLAEKIEELQKSSRIEESQVRNCSNFDKKACHLRRRLEKLGFLSNENGMDELQQMEKRGITNQTRVSGHKSTDDAMPKEEKCSGHCKAVVLRIVEQVRAETEQWSQMQKMLEKVRGEMEELQASRDYWERAAHNADYEAQSLRHALEAWKGRALDYEKQVKELELKLSLVKQKKTRDSKQDVVVELPLGAQLVKERLALSCSNSKMNYHLEEMSMEGNKKTMPPPLSLAKQLAREKRSLIRSLKGSNGTKRSPLRDIANSSLLERQNHRIAFQYLSPESSRIRESFRK